MHELSLALEIRDLCEREMVRHDGVRLSGLGLEVGALAGVDLESLRFCLGVVLEERFGDVLCEIRRVPGEAQCLVCTRRFEVVEAPFDCPDCGSRARGVAGGGELQITYLEVE